MTELEVTPRTWLDRFNSTNGKILAGIFMAIEVVTTVCLMEVFGKHFNEILLLEILAFIAAWAGISYAQFAKKRETTIITPPQTTAENAIPVAAVAQLPTRQREDEAVG